jgi:hypothetical protein
MYISLVSNERESIQCVNSIERCHIDQEISITLEILITEGFHPSTAADITLVLNIGADMPTQVCKSFMNCSKMYPHHGRDMIAGLDFNFNQYHNDSYIFSYILLCN